MKVVEKRGARRVLSLLPERIKIEIESLSGARVRGLSGLSEVALRARGRCFAIFADGAIPLSSVLSSVEIGEILFRICDGALYAFRDSIAEGYIPLGDGVRVGVAGLARYEGGEIVGVNEVGTLIFRIPTGECEFKEELFSAYDGGIGTGMLIYSPPGVGKTTALRALAAHVGSGTGALRVAVVDERQEFCAEDYAGCRVDILAGYRRCEGIEIATRTMAPDLIMTDELSGEDAEGLCRVLGSGVPIVATAHAGDLSTLMKKPSLRSIMRSGVFEVLVGISRTGMGYSLKVDRP